MNVTLSWKFDAPSFACFGLATVAYGSARMSQDHLSGCNGGAFGKWKIYCTLFIDTNPIF
jgi:hypothetical protein